MVGTVLSKKTWQRSGLGTQVYAVVENGFTGNVVTVCGHGTTPGTDLLESK